MWCFNSDRKFLKIAACILILGLAACNWQPLYAPQNSGVSVLAPLSRIAVAKIPDRVGQDVRIALLDILNAAESSGNAEYELSVNLSERTTDTLVEKTGDITRNRYTLTANYQLKKHATQAIIHKGTTFSIVSYNAVDNQFATLSAAIDAKERAARAVADNIGIELANYFTRKDQGL